MYVSGATARPDASRSGDGAPVLAAAAGARCGSSPAGAVGCGARVEPWASGLAAVALRRREETIDRARHRVAVLGAPFAANVIALTSLRIGEIAELDQHRGKIRRLQHDETGRALGIVVEPRVALPARRPGRARKYGRRRASRAASRSNRMSATPGASGLRFDRRPPCRRRSRARRCAPPRRRKRARSRYRRSRRKRRRARLAACRRGSRSAARRWRRGPFARDRPARRTRRRRASAPPCSARSASSWRCELRRESVDQRLSRPRRPARSRRRRRRRGRDRARSPVGPAAAGPAVAARGGGRRGLRLRAPPPRKRWRRSASVRSQAAPPPRPWRSASSRPRRCRPAARDRSRCATCRPEQAEAEALDDLPERAALRRPADRRIELEIDLAAYR